MTIKFVVLSSEQVSSYEMTLSHFLLRWKRRRQTDLTGAPLVRYRVPIRRGHLLTEWPWKSHQMFQCCGSSSVRKRSFHLPQSFKVKERTCMEVHFTAFSDVCVRASACHCSLPLCPSLQRAQTRPLHSHPLSEAVGTWEKFLQDKRKWLQIYQVHLKLNIRRNFVLKSQRDLWGSFLWKFLRKF